MIKVNENNVVFSGSEDALHYMAEIVKVILEFRNKFQPDLKLSKVLDQIAIPMMLIEEAEEDKKSSKKLSPSEKGEFNV